MVAFRHTAYSEDAAHAVARGTDVPLPAASARGEVLLRVHASGFNAGDVFMGRGGARAVFGLAFPATVGRDVAGVVEAVVPGSETTLRPGDRVVGIVLVGKGRGTFAEYCVVQAKHLVLIPDNVSFADAAALPTAGCTTWQALVGRGVLRAGAGQRILVLGGSCGTGLAAIQLARAAGCSEIATTSSQAELVRAAGATRVVDHRAGEDWSTMLAGGEYDIVYDCIEGLPAWGKAQAVLKASGATFVSIVMEDAHADVHISDMLRFMCRVAYRWMWSWAGYPRFVLHSNLGSREGLPELVALVAAGGMRALLDGPPRPPTAEAFAEMWNVQISHRAHGKLVMRWLPD
jgi:NADPH:quinone reductase-like Zn-dependent oxidoreductase